MTAVKTRRDFLRDSALLGAGVWLGTSLDTARADSSPNEKLNLAVIGLGGQGTGNMKAAGSQHNIVALCDVDDVRAGNAYELFPAAKKFKDFRKMYDELENQIDGVVISTPDHTHFNPAYLALRAGKHVYLEKPMAHSVWEARRLTKLAAEKKVATQLGVQRHTIEGVHRVVELIQSGAIGTVSEVYSWVGGDRGMPTTPTNFPPVPGTLDWDLWLGPAKDRPYSADYVPYKWRFWWDFGTGEAGNWGCHILDIPYWALNLKYPTKVSVPEVEVDPERTPKSMASRFEFPAEGGRGPIVLHWHHGKPKDVVDMKLPKDKDGKDPWNTVFIGDKGKLICGFGPWKLLPEDDYQDFKAPSPTIPKSPGFHKEWFTACKGGPAATCDFAYSGPMSETVLLANAAVRAKGGFDWNAETMTATGNPNVEQYLKS
ncbi:MAG TPA: Gfo/Idh/MocA family oxidoreductase, partial [Pirellulales bacterium]